MNAIINWIQTNPVAVTGAIAAAIRARRAHLEPAQAYHLDRGEQLDPEIEARVRQAQALIAIGRLRREG